MNFLTEVNMCNNFSVSELWELGRLGNKMLPYFDLFIRLCAQTNLYRKLVE